MRGTVLYFAVEVGTADIILSSAMLLARFPLPVRKCRALGRTEGKAAFPPALLWGRSPEFLNALMVQGFSQPRNLLLALKDEIGDS